MKFEEIKAKLKVVGNREETERLQVQLAELGPEMMSLFVKDVDSGGAFLYGDPATGGVLEVVFGHKPGVEDSISTLFQNCALFEKSNWVSMRKTLIREIAAKLGTIPRAIELQDEGRNREVYLTEMSSAQLLDIAEKSNIQLQ